MKYTNYIKKKYKIMSRMFEHKIIIQYNVRFISGNW